MRNPNSIETFSTPSFSNEDVEVITREPLYQGFFKLFKYTLKHKLFAGGWSQPIQREILERGHAVAVLPYDPCRDEVVLIEQFRAGAMATSETPWLYECIAGVIDAGETPESVCHREAQEEAGLELLELHPMLNYLSSPGGTTERLYLYWARVDASNAGGIHGLEHEGEDIRVRKVKTSELFDLLDNGKLDNAATLISAQWLKIHLAELQRSC
jgi:ADP-ribose pyrophosphatase